MIIAPCCFSQQVSVHHSPAADEVRKDVRLRLAAGETREQILNAYVSQYGKRILAEPPAEGFDRALYVLPPLLLILSAALVVGVVRRFSRRPATVAAVAIPAASPTYDARLDDELRDLD
jgi:cytochrome c-type biogenesis protein CcmH